MPLLVMRGFQDAQDMDNKGRGWISEMRGHQIDDTLGPYGGFILSTVKVTDPRVFRGRVPISQEVTTHHREDNDKLVATVTEYVLEADELDAQSLISGRVGWIVLQVRNEEEARLMYASPEERQAWVEKRLAPSTPPAERNMMPAPAMVAHPARVADTEASPPQVSNPVTADPSVMPHSELRDACKALAAAGGPDISLNSPRPVLEQYYREVANATD